MSAVYNVNTSGPIIVPCRTPILIGTILSNIQRSIVYYYILFLFILRAESQKLFIGDFLGLYKIQESAKRCRCDQIGSNTQAMYGCSRVVLVAGAVKRNTSRPIVQDELPKVLMVPSTGSEKGVSQAGSAVENGPGLYTPSGPQGSGTLAFLHNSTLILFMPHLAPSHFV